MENPYEITPIDVLFCIPEAARPWVLPALLQDAAIWTALGNAEFRQRAIQVIGDQPERWCPAELCFLDLDLPAPRESTPIDPELRLRCIQAYQDLVHPEAPKGSPGDESSLSRAALLAIAILENRRRANSWSFLRDDLAHSLANRPDHAGHWGTALGVVYSLAQDRLALLRALLQPHSDETFFHLALQGLLSNPRPPAEYVQILSSVCSELPFEDSIQLLNCLSLTRPALAQGLADHLLGHGKAISKKGRREPQSSPARQLENALMQARLLNLGGHPAEAKPFFEQAADLLQSIWEGVAQEMVQPDRYPEDAEKALESWKAILTRPSAAPPPARLIVSLLEKGQTQVVQRVLPLPEREDSSALGSLAAAQTAYEEGDLPAARQAARRCLNAAFELVSGGASQVPPGQAEQRLRAARPLFSHLGELCLMLNLYSEAMQAASLAFGQNPTDPWSWAELASVCRRAGKPARAVQCAELAVALQPDDLNLRRELAASLEAGEDFPAALEERTRILDARFAPPNEAVWPAASEWHALAACAIQAGKPDVAIQAAQSALHLNPEDGLAQAYLGEALLANGDIERALDCLTLATQLAPHEAKSWLFLARAYQGLGEGAKTSETLRLAAHAVPDDPGILLALAESYMDERALSQARAALARAYDLLFNPGQKSSFAPSFQLPSGRAFEDIRRKDRELPCRVAMLYGQVLLDLGHPEEARQVFESAYQAAPAYPGLAYAMASTLVKTGNLRAAVAPFVVAVGAAPKDPHPYLEYASTLLFLGEDADEAIQSIQKSLDVIQELESSAVTAGENLGLKEAGSIPSASSARDSRSKEDIRSLRIEALALLAQALEASGQLEASLKAYSSALETGAASEQGRDVDLSLGMARIALRLEQPEMAIAALQEASHKEATVPLIHRTLAEAYAAIHLPDEALQYGRLAIQGAPDNTELLIWFADLCSSLGAHKEAVPVLSRAMQLDTRNSEPAVRLGLVLSQLHRVEEARQAFMQVLNNPDAANQDLIQASRSLQALGDQPAAIKSLERAVSSAPEPTSGLLQELAVLLQKAGQMDRALEILDQAVQSSPQDISVLYRKAELLQHLDRMEAAKASLERAAQISPSDPAIRLRLASILSGQGDFDGALKQAEIALSVTQGAGLVSENLAARGICAELARAMLQMDKAAELLEGRTEAAAPAFLPEKGWQNSPMGRFLGLDRRTGYYCTAAELFLDNDEEIAAAEALTGIVDQGSTAVRVQALQSRLAFRRGDYPLALQILHKAVENAELSCLPDPGVPAEAAEKAAERPCSWASSTGRRGHALDWLSIGMAGIDLEQWETALESLDRAAVLSADPYVLLQQARGVTLRAEFQQLCQAIDAQAHAPGPAALDRTTYHAFKEKIESAQQGLAVHPPSQPNRIIQRWQARGQAVFNGGSEALKALEQVLDRPEDFAAYLAQLAKAGDLVAVNGAQDAMRRQFGGLPSHPALLVQVALSKGLKGRRNEDLSGSMSAIQSAIEQRPHQPLYHAVLGRLAKVLGNPSLALHAMLTALSFWPDEPQWQATVANLYLDAGDVPAAISHLEKAISQEPDRLPYYLQLGKAHLEVGDCGQAIAALERAVQVSPDQAESHMALASAYFLSGDLQKAAASSERAARLDAKNLPALLLRAEIALRAEAYEQARDGAEQVLQIKPDHPQAQHLLVQALHRLGSLEAALKVAEQAIPGSESPLPLMLDRISILEKLNGSRATLQALQELAHDYPDDPQVLTQLARSLGQAGETAEAIRIGQRALRNVDHEMYPADKAALHHMLGLLLQQAGQLDQAIHQLGEATRLAPDQLPVLLDLGAIQLERRQFARALETYQEAIDLAPDDPRPYFQAGMALKMSRDYAEAEAMLRRASELAPEDLIIHRQLAALIALNLVHSHRAANVAA